ncbi:hypothetical protein HHK36_006360 [Tetracentron sinense]|uniref:Uncharacterized protein n=1 Tax=Tetracentron sinense TaxID=13715 RepID=A0A835DKS9_TETSI|nr:hypothetical protein HHK36_006360 [Tetracentron sinense]
MMVPVVTKTGGANTDEGEKKMAMKFLLLSNYTKMEGVPKPEDESMVIKEEVERKYGVVKFGGVTTYKMGKERVEKLKKSLERDGFNVIGEFLLARYMRT